MSVVHQPADLEFTSPEGAPPSVSFVMLCDARQANYPLVFVDAAFTALTGYTAGEALGRNPRFLQGPLTDLPTRQLIREALTAGVSTQCEIVNYRKSGEPYYCSLTIEPLRDTSGAISHFVGFQHDRTREHEAALNLVKAERQLRSLTDNLPGYIYRRVMHPDGTLTYPFFSRSIFRILGMPDDTDWSGEEFITHMHADDRPAFVRNALQSGRALTPLLCEFRIVAPSGRQVWFRSTSTPRDAGDGRVVWEGWPSMSPRKSSPTCG